MGITTQIEWCDSTVNSMMGCNGCELWIPKAGIRDCYAGVMTARYAGNNGWPAAFDQPRHFPGRIETALRWPDLTGVRRPNKPWLNDLPRTIFLDDLGDTFTESLDTAWLEPLIPCMADSSHIWIFLTKRPKRMFEFFKHVGDIPQNFWLGTTITSMASAGRLKDLQKLRHIGTHDNILWCSFEPLMGPIELSVRDGRYIFGSTPQFVDDELCDFDLEPMIDWASIGGGSHMTRMMQPDSAFDLMDWLEAAEVPIFFKQWGSLKVNPDPNDPTARENGGMAKGGRLVRGREINGMPGLMPKWA